MQRCWFLACAGYPAVAVGVNETGVVRRAGVPAGGDLVFGDRRAGDAMPLFPFLGTGTLHLLIGRQRPNGHSENVRRRPARTLRTMALVMSWRRRP